MRVLTVYLKNHTLECAKRVCDTLEKCGAESELFALSDGYGELYAADGTLIVKGIWEQGEFKKEL